MTNNASLTPETKGASVVITHHVNPALQAEYETWLQEIGPVCRSSAGLLDWHIIRPIAGYTDTYSVMIRYETERHLTQWLDSPERQTLIAKAAHLLAGQEEYQVSSGLDFLFMQPNAASTKPPVPPTPVPPTPVAPAVPAAAAAAAAAPAASAAAAPAAAPKAAK